MRWRGWTAWLVSALAHALLAGLLHWRAGAAKAPDPDPPASPIEIEITEIARPTPVGPSETLRAQKQSVSARAPATAEPPGGRASQRLIPPRADGALDRGDEATRVDRPTGPPLPEGRANAAPDLSLHALSPDAQARIAVPAADAGLAGGAHKHSVDELRVDREREEDAVANVRAGRADPLLYDYLRDARVRFEDEAHRIGEAIPIGAGQTIRGWARGLTQRVQEIQQGDRVADEVRPDLRTEAEKQRPDLAAAYDENRRQAEAGAEIRRVEVCLDVSPGRETTSTLRRGSGNAALDRAALEAFARSVSVHEVPPDARAGRACYEVRVAVFRAGPAPGVSCDLSLGPHGPTCVWPLKKMVSVTSQLLSVDYPDKKDAPAPSSLVRRAR